MVPARKNTASPGFARLRPASLGLAWARPESMEPPERDVSDRCCSASGACSAEHASVEDQRHEQFQAPDAEVKLPVAKMVKAPSEPSQVERDYHYLAHIPFADWCEFCIMGKMIIITRWIQRNARIKLFLLCRQTTCS